MEGRQHERTPHITISVADILPVCRDENFLTDIKTSKLNIDLNRYEVHAYASLEWIVPTAIGAYLFKSYFDGFLKEMGKDHYSILKNFLIGLSNQAREFNVKLIAATKSTEKIKKVDSQSKVFSIEADSKFGHRIKFLFNEELSNGTWELYIAKALEILDQHYSQEDDFLSQEIINNKVGKYVFAVIDITKEQWKFVSLDFMRSDLYSDKFNFPSEKE